LNFSHNNTMGDSSSRRAPSKKKKQRAKSTRKSTTSNAPASKTQQGVRKGTEEIRYDGVIYQETSGSLVLTETTMEFHPETTTPQQHEFAVGWDNVVKHSANAASNTTPKLRVVINNNGVQKNEIFRFITRDELLRLQKDSDSHKASMDSHHPPPAAGNRRPSDQAKKEVLPEGKQVSNICPAAPDIPVAVASAVVSPEAVEDVPTVTIPIKKKPKLDETDVQMQAIERWKKSVKSRAGNPKPATGPPAKEPAMWAISYQQLMDIQKLVEKKLGRKYQQATMRDVNKAIIEPSCAEHGKSYALTLNPVGLKLDAFVTHAWDEPFDQFIESIQHVFHTTMEKPNLWICAFALFQGDAKAIAAQVGAGTDSLDDSPFARALSGASMYVVVRNSSVDIYSRIWCVAELLHSKKLGLVPGKAFVTGPDNFSDLQTSCLDAQAFNPKVSVNFYQMAGIF